MHGRSSFISMCSPVNFLRTNRPSASIRRAGIIPMYCRSSIGICVSCSFVGICCVSIHLFTSSICSSPCCACLNDSSEIRSSVVFEAIW